MVASDDAGKGKEIERAQCEVDRCLETKVHHGQPSFCLTFDENGEALTPGQQLDDVVRILDFGTPAAPTG